MDQYAEIVGENASSEDYHKIAAHYEDAGDHYKAGKFFFASKQYDKVHMDAHFPGSSCIGSPNIGFTPLPSLSCCT
jgi:hypothetical protein